MESIAAITAIGTLLTASFAMQPALAQSFQDKSETPSYIRAKPDPNGCVTSGDDTRCATASTSGGADIKVVEDTSGTWLAGAYHEMYFGLPGSPSSGFYIDVTPGYSAQFESYVEGKVDIAKNGKTVQARYGGIVCDADGFFIWRCDRYYGAMITTDGTHTIPAGTIVSAFMSVPSDPVNERYYTMGSLFECYTTGSGGGVTHTECDASTNTLYWKSTKLRVSWPYI